MTSDYRITAEYIYIQNGESHSATDELANGVNNLKGLYILELKLRLKSKNGGQDLESTVAHLLGDTVTIG